MRCFSQLASVLLHLALLYLGAQYVVSEPQFALEAGEASVEVELVAAPAEVLPVDTPRMNEPEPVQTPEPVMPEPEPQVQEEKREELAPVPPQEPVVTEPPVPVSATPPPKTEVKKQVQKAQPVKTVAVKKAALRAAGDNSSVMPGQDATTARSSGAQQQASPDYLRNPAPEYPEAARRAKEEGIVLVRVTVSEKGIAAAVELAQSSGYSRLDQAALNAVKRWRFKPGKTSGIPVASEVEVPVRFKLN